VPAGTITMPPGIVADLPVVNLAYNNKYHQVNLDETTLALAIEVKNIAGGKVRLLVNNFLQVLRITVVRSVALNDGDWQANDVDYYNLDETGGNLPDISTDEDALEWANIIVQGEADRIAAKPTAPPMTNPTAAQVNAFIAPFETAIDAVSAANTAITNSRSDLVDYNITADAFILEVWNYLDANTSKLSDSARRNILRTYGVVFISLGTPNIIKAHVKRASDNSNLIGAIATIQETGATVTANADGLIEISSTALGPLTVLFTFPGLADQTLPVTIPDDAEGQTFDLGTVVMAV